MIIVDNKLKSRSERKNPIRAGIIGTGAMGIGLINQIVKYTPGIIPSVIYNRNINKAFKALNDIGITDYLTCDNVTDLNRHISNDLISVTDNIDLLINCKGLDLVIELTGTIDFAADTILKAIDHGKKVLSFNAELESTLGFYIRQKAIENNVAYSLADGDQPAVTMNLYRFVKQMGLTPLVCGNIKGLHDKTRTPLTQEKFAAEWDMTPHMVTSFADGTKLSFEQACIANATNMSVAQRGMLGYSSNQNVDELMHLFDIDLLEEKGGIVDYIVGAKPGPGVFIYAKAPQDPLFRKNLHYMKMGQGPLYCFYTPYHLLYLEMAASIPRLVDFDDIILAAEYGMKVEVVAVAKTNLNKGDIIDGLGGFKTYGLCEAYNIAREQKLLPMGIAEGAQLLRDIKMDEPITFDDIKFPENKLSVDLYFKQLKLLLQNDFH